MANPNPSHKFVKGNRAAAKPGPARIKMASTLSPEGMIHWAAVTAHLGKGRGEALDAALSEYVKAHGIKISPEDYV